MPYEAGPAMAGQIPDRAYILYLQIYLMLGYFNGRIPLLHGGGDGSIPSPSTKQLRCGVTG